MAAHFRCPAESARHHHDRHARYRPMTAEVVAIRSKPRQPFAMVAQSVLADKSLTDGECRLFCLLCSYANEDGECFPSVGRLVADMGANRSRTFERLKSLEQKTLIKRQSFPGKCSVIRILRGRPNRKSDGSDPCPKPARVDNEPVPVSGTGGVLETGTGTRARFRDTEHTSINIPPNKTMPVGTGEPSASPPHGPGSAQSKSKSKRRRKPETPFPEGLVLPDELRAHAKPGVDVDEDFARFRDHALTHDRRCRDWKAAWRNWCRSDKPKPMKAQSANSTARLQLTEEQRRARDDRL